MHWLNMYLEFILAYSRPKYCNKIDPYNISSEIDLTLELISSKSDSLILLKLPCLSCLHIKQSPAMIVCGSLIATLGSKPISQPSSLHIRSISSVSAVHSIKPSTKSCSAYKVFSISMNPCFSLVYPYIFIFHLLSYFFLFLFYINEGCNEPLHPPF